MTRNIVHLVSPYLFNTGSWIYSQMKNLKGYESHVFTTFRENPEQYPHESVVAAWEFPEPKKFVSRFMLRFFDRQGVFYRPHHDRLKPLLYQAHMGFEGVRWLDFVKGTKTPLVTTFYGQDVSKLGRLEYWQKKYLKLFEYGSLFLAEGSNLKNELVKLGCPEEKVAVQHLGVDPAKYRVKKRKGAHGGKTIILQAASYKPKKGYQTAIAAIRDLAETRNDFEFRVIGSGSAEEVAEMESWVTEYGVGDKVVLLGALKHDQYRAELASADIFFHPSQLAPDGDTEGGAPVGITEACAMGLPVVATLHADIPEVVLDGKTGLLAPEKDHEALASHLSKLIDNPALRDELGAAGRRRIETEYNIFIQMEKLARLYDDVIKKWQTK